MRVLQFITRLDLGGAQECCLDQCRLLLAAGSTVHLLTGTEGELMPAARAMPGLVLHVWPDWHHAIRPAADLRCLMRLASLLRSERFDVLHTHGSKAGIVGRFAARFANRPATVIHHIHGWSFNETQPATTRFFYVTLEKLAAKHGFILLACSEATSEQGRRMAIGHERDRRVVHYGIERRELLRNRPRAAIRRRLGLGVRDLLFLQLGNLKPQKDPITFARAAVTAGRRLRRARFWIAGDGPLRAATETLARDGGLGSRFQVLGWRRDVADLLAAADVLVLTSRFEGLPLAIVRGMSAGLPVVATAVDGTPEAVADGETGLLISPGNDAQAAAAIVRLGLDSALRHRMGRRGRERSRRFRIERFRREVLDLYGIGRAGQRRYIRVPNEPAE